MFAVEVENLTKIYGEGDRAVTALTDASFTVRPGELVAILGPSGSGKTTLLTTIGLVNEPTRGRVMLDGELVADDGWRAGLDIKKVRREKLGFIFQAHNLIPFLTTLENVMIAMDINGVPPKEAKARGIELLESLGLGHRLNHYPALLSGGESQRTAIARALANPPGVILVVTHDQRMVEGFDTIYTVSDGRIVGERRNGHSPEA